MLLRRRRSVVLVLAAASGLMGCPSDPDPGTDAAVCRLIDVGPSFEPEVDASDADVADVADVAPEAGDSAVADADALTDAGSDVVADADADAATDVAPAAFPKSLDAGAPVTFADVQAILTVSCTFSTCHGQVGNVAGLYLPRDAPAGWRAQLVGVRSKENPDMFRVKPYDPSQSWMAHKVLGDNCMFTSACLKNDCGDRMPQANDPLPDEQLDVILRWIRQGAPE